IGFLLAAISCAVLVCMPPTVPPREPEYAMTLRLLALACAGLALAACNGNASRQPDGATQDVGAPQAAVPAAAEPAADNAEPFASTEVASFDEPWAMAFLPDGRLLVTEKPGALKLVDVATGKVGDIKGVPG